MKTDKQLYALFEAHPQWVFELTGLESPGECEWQAVALKALEQQSDGVIFPTDPAKPLTVVKFQFQEDPTIYARTVIEMALLQQEHAMREVQGVIFFRFPYLDPQTEPWRQIIHPYQLRETLKTLAQQDAAHPLVAVFQPVLLTNKDTLEKNATVFYNHIQASNMDDSVKQTMLDVFVSWLEQRFDTLGIEEIRKMFIGELPNLRETQSGKDLIQIGKDEGKIEGEQEALVWAMEAKFGTLSATTRQQIQQIQSVDKLKDLLLQVLKVDTIDQLIW